MKRLAVRLTVVLLTAGGALLVSAPHASACGVYFSLDELPTGATYTSYYLDEGWDAYWIYVVEPAPGMYCGS